MKIRAHHITAPIEVQTRAEGDTSTDLRIDVTFATPTPVRRYNWRAGEEFNEVLEISKKAIDGTRLTAGAPLLDSHGSYRIADQIGVVESWSIDGDRARATVRISNRAELAGLRQDISDGIVKNVSVGYKVNAYRREAVEEGKTPQYTATSWTPMEISLVTVPADHLAGIGRANPEGEEFDVLVENELRMEKETPTGLEQQPTTPQQPQVDAAAIRAEAAKAERERANLIVNAVRSAKLDTALADTLIADGVTVDQARARVIEELAKQDQAPARTEVKIGADGDQKRAAAMSDGLMLRAGYAPAEVAPGAASFRGLSMLRLADEYLRSQGVNTSGMSDSQMAMEAMKRRSVSGAMGTSDFPTILGNTIGRVLRADYEAQQRTFQPFTRRGTASNFKNLTRAQISGLVGDFEQVVEGGEYKRGTMTEAAETYKVLKYGRTIALTWETLIDDDLDAFSRIPRAVAVAAADKQSDMIYSILSTNANMYDGAALFVAGHGNLAGAATGITTAGLAAARAAMRKQTGLDGRKINVQAKYLICGPDKEEEALQILNATIVATKTTDTNTFRGSLELIVDPRITGNTWYLSANPSAIDTIEYAFLDGQPELFTEMREGFEIDGMEIKARMVFGCKALDWRGLYKNAGA